MAYLGDLMEEEDPRKRLAMTINKMVTDAGTVGHPLAMTPPGIAYRAAKDGPGMLKGLWNTFTTPGDILAGKKKATVGDAAKFALDVGIGGGAFGTAPKGALRTFAGRNAKTADLAALAKAEAMEKAGVGRDEIWRATGWGRGVDKKWRFEIDDSAAFLESPRHAPSGYLRLQHDDAAAAYPGHWNAMQQSIRQSDNVPATGMYHPDTNTIVAEGPRRELRGIALHEGMHAVQNKEGFAKGGNWRGIGEKMAGAERESLVRKYDEALAKDPLLRTAMRDRALFHAEMHKKYGKDWSDFATKDELKKQASIDDAVLSRPDGENVISVEDMLINLPDKYARKAYDEYRRLAGETEARLVSARKNLTPDERIATPPWSNGPYGYDVPEADQILRSAAPPVPYSTMEDDRDAIVKYLRQRALEKFAAEGGT